MQAQQLIRDGDLAGALQVLQQAVRENTADAKLRTFLFQLLAVMGDWQRALTQLNVAGELDAATLPMVQTYRAAIQCEALRAAVFAGERTPHIFGEPPDWIGLLVEALRLDRGTPERAEALRAQAFELASASAGTLDGTPFDWLADADQRLGPVLEAVVDGRYGWLPFMRLAALDIEPPADLRDAVWAPATFTFVTGTQSAGLIPVRYAGTVEEGDDALKLARRTEWNGPRGLGQRMFATDAGEHALLDTRSIVLEGSGESGNG
ncbi:type VI secretion system accessory protein TagJ [Massilia sp. YMA4]|uniref:type VI secretion system accessory protein TagJ n=1 Tax=Massilia sp. YMA4 TaxID=1593482 RepID=UPI000DD16D7A|nr:type VI secretion system accessory protein TagJ [Massilia sp. YMA4]AXA90520.1 virulence protein SciE type [Massilia sp. YMA4]